MSQLLFSVIYLTLNEKKQMKMLFIVLLTTLTCHTLSRVGVCVCRKTKLLCVLSVQLWVSGVSGSAAKERSQPKLPGHLRLYPSASRCQEWVWASVLFTCCCLLSSNSCLSLFIATAHKCSQCLLVVNKHINFLSHESFEKFGLWSILQPLLFSKYC